MRRFVPLLLALAAFLAGPAYAQPAAPPVNDEWAEDGADRVVAALPVSLPPGIAAYGPFRVLDEARAVLVDATDSASPRAFAAMLRDHPGIGVLEMLECPGTEDDVANLRLGRMIRAAGLATHVPAQGSVRSGAVELFLAGTTRRIEDGAEFAVHAWRDDDGHEPRDYAADSPANRMYLDFYREMGLARPQAFYEMTNTVPNADARWLTAQDMRAWLGEAGEGAVTVRSATIAYLDLGTTLP